MLKEALAPHRSFAIRYTTDKFDTGESQFLPQETAAALPSSEKINLRIADGFESFLRRDDINRCDGCIVNSPAEARQIINTFPQHHFQLIYVKPDEEAMKQCGQSRSEQEDDSFKELDKNKEMLFTKNCSQLIPCCHQCQKEEMDQFVKNFLCHDHFVENVTAILRDQIAKNLLAATDDGQYLTCTDSNEPIALYTYAERAAEKPDDLYTILTHWLPRPEIDIEKMIRLARTF